MGFKIRQKKFEVEIISTSIQKKKKTTNAKNAPIWPKSAQYYQNYKKMQTNAWKCTSCLVNHLRNGRNSLDLPFQVDVCPKRNFQREVTTPWEDNSSLLICSEVADCDAKSSWAQQLCCPVAHPPTDGWWLLNAG